MLTEEGPQAADATPVLAEGLVVAESPGSQKFVDLTPEGPESADMTPVMAEGVVVTESPGSQKFVDLTPEGPESADMTPVLAEGLVLEGPESQKFVDLTPEGPESADMTPVLAEGVMVVESPGGQNLVDLAPRLDEDLVLENQSGKSEACNTARLMVWSVIAGEAYRESQETPKSVDVTPVLGEDLPVLGEESEWNQKNLKSADTSEALTAERADPALDGLPSLSSQELVVPCEVSTSSEQAPVDLASPAMVDEVSAPGKASVKSGSAQEASVSSEVQCSTEESTPMEVNSVSGAIPVMPVSSAEKDFTSSSNAESPDQQTTNPVENVPVNLSTPETEASMALLLEPTAGMSSASGASTLPSEQTSPPTGSFPSTLLTLGEDTLAATDERPTHLEGGPPLLEGVESLPLLDSPAVPRETESNQNRAGFVTDESPVPGSEAVPGGGATSDDYLTSLDGSGGFELTVGELQMPLSASDGTIAAAAATEMEADGDDVTDADITNTTAITNTTDYISVPTTNGAAAATATVATTEDTAAQSCASEDPGETFRLSLEIETAVGTVEDIASEGDPQSLSAVANPGSKYRVSSEPATVLPSAEGLSGQLQDEQHDQQQHQPQEWDSAGEDAEFWEGLRRAAEQTQALVAEAQRQSPQKTYRSMFLGDADDAATSATSATSPAASAASWDTAKTSAASATASGGFARHETTPGDAAFSRHARRDSGGFDPLGPPADGPGAAAFGPLELEQERQEEQDAALAAVRAELRRALPQLDSSSAEPEEEEDREELAAVMCPPAVPGLETISEEAEDEEEDAEEEDRPPDHIPDSWREDFDDAFVEVSDVW